MSQLDKATLSETSPRDSVQSDAAQSDAVQSDSTQSNSTQSDPAQSDLVRCPANQPAEDTFANHPCFHAKASVQWGRLHLPVAPNCNIQCNFCNRKYDCVNESRPGVTNKVLQPFEAVALVNKIMKERSDIAVVGIAGPGDPMCDAEETLETMRGVRACHPEVMLCVSSNGLNMPPHVDDLVKAGISHVTITVNAVTPDVATQIYSFVKKDGLVHTGLAGVKLLLDAQAEAVQALKEHHIIVKINTVILPGINLEHIPEIAEKVASWGADVMNCIPVIPVEGTPFAHLPSPEPEEIHTVRQAAGQFIRQNSHCRRCRADAIGLLCSS